MHLYEVSNGSVTWWAVAPSDERAVELVFENEVRNLGADPEEIGALDARMMSIDDAKKLRYRDDGIAESCSLALAFEIAREHEQVLCCSEWP